MELQEFIDVDAFTKEINEDISDISEAMRTQTARAAYYSIMTTKAKKQKAKVDLFTKIIEAKLTKTMRQKLVAAAVELAEEEGTKPEKITVDMVKAEVALHPEMREWMQRQIDADEIYSVCKAAYDAFFTRREMLKGLGQMSRTQMEQQMRLINRTVSEEVGNSRSRYIERKRAREAASVSSE